MRFEANANGMLGRANIVPAGIAMHLNFGGRCKLRVAIAPSDQLQGRSPFPGRTDARRVWIDPRR